METGSLRLVDRLVMVLVGACMILGLVLAVGQGAHEGLRIIMALLALGVAYGLVRGCLLLRGGALAPLGWLGVTAVAAALMLGLWLILSGGRSVAQSDSILRLELLLTLLAVLVCDVAWATRWPLRGLLIRVVAAAALAGVGIPLLLSLVALVTQSWWVFDLLGGGSRGGGWLVLAVLVGLVAHLVLPALGNWERQREASRLAGMADRALATLQCPRCEQWLQMRSGLIACPTCALGIRFEFNEPRCRCGYPLHRLAAACCPECGRDVPTNERWGRAARSGERPSVSPPVPSPPSA
jgi:hypothetical protein